MARARAGDTIAWEVLFQRCYPKVVRVVRRKLNPPMRSLYDSTDFASDVMKSLAANLQQLEFDSFNSLMAFLVQTAKRKVVDEYRKVHTLKRDIDRQKHLGAVEEDGGGVALALESDEPTASKFAQADEAHECLVQDQDEVRREVIELRVMGNSNDEIADHVGWSLRKVQRYLKDLEDRYFRRWG
ncbi:MAG: RNA polymerase sigma factor [Isosphaeraceae bacterium]